MKRSCTLLLTTLLSLGSFTVLSATSLFNTDKTFTVQPNSDCYGQLPSNLQNPDPGQLSEFCTCFVNNCVAGGAPAGLCSDPHTLKVTIDTFGGGENGACHRQQDTSDDSIRKCLFILRYVFNEPEESPSGGPYGWHCPSS